MAYTILAGGATSRRTGNELLALFHASAERPLPALVATLQDAASAADLVLEREQVGDTHNPLTITYSLYPAGQRDEPIDAIELRRMEGLSARCEAYRALVGMLERVEAYRRAKDDAEAAEYEAHISRHERLFGP